MWKSTAMVPIGKSMISEGGKLAVHSEPQSPPANSGAVKQLGACANRKPLRNRNTIKSSGEVGDFVINGLVCKIEKIV